MSLSVLFGAGLLAGYATVRSPETQPDDIVIQQIYDLFDGYRCTELCNLGALQAVGQIFDLNLENWWPKVDSGCFKVIVITQPGGPVDRNVVVLLESAGSYGWYLSEAYKHGYRMVRSRLDYQHINQLIDGLNTDPAEVVAQTAAEILDPVKRYQYLRHALIANPRLSALLSRSGDFLHITRMTVEEPEVRQIQTRQGRRVRPQPDPTMRALPVYDEVPVELRERERVRRQ